MYEQGQGANFKSERFFDKTKYWYHVATNARSEGSIWRKISGKATTCDNVITQYADAGNGTFAYRNGCYVKGQYNKGLTRNGTLVPTDPAVPSRFSMMDSQGKQPSLYQIVATDYDNFALVTDGGSTFWILSRTPEICGNTLGNLETKLTKMGFDTTNITVDFKVIKECQNK